MKYSIIICYKLFIIWHKEKFWLQNNYLIEIYNWNMIEKVKYIYIYEKEKNKETIIIKKITILKKEEKKIKGSIEIHCAWKNIKDTK